MLILRVEFPLTCPEDTVSVCGGGGLGGPEYLAYHLSLIQYSCVLISNSCYLLKCNDSDV